MISQRAKLGRVLVGALMAVMMGAIPGCMPVMISRDHGGLQRAEELIESRGINAPAQPTPAAVFPARVAVALVTPFGDYPRHRYREKPPEASSERRFQLVGGRDPSRIAERFAKLPSLAAAVSLSPQLVPTNFGSDFEPRVAASRLKADMLLIYSLFTEVEMDGVPLGPVSIATFGMIPNKTATASVRASCVLIDVRTGFVYCSARASHQSTDLATRWRTCEAASSAIDAAQGEALDKLWDQFEPAWRETVRLHAK